MSYLFPIEPTDFCTSALPSCDMKAEDVATLVPTHAVSASLSTPELYNALPVPYLILASDGTIQAANTAGAATLGYTSQALVGQSLLSFLQSDDQSSLGSVLRTMEATPARLESWQGQLFVADRKPLWVSATAQTVLHQGHRAIAFMFYDLSNVHLQMQRSQAALEQQVQQRTVQLQLAFNYEATLKRITDRVRDSLDERQILETAVRELACGLDIQGCNAAMFDLSQGTSTIYYEYTAASCCSNRRVSHIDSFPELYQKILQGQTFQFCSLLSNPHRGQVTLLVCPIRDDRGILGSLWLISGSTYCFNEQDIRLVEQVANQCAIAIRQARLYEASQAQVIQLERLNQLKDDFLSTISHELRTPITSMKMALQMLGVSLNQELSLFAELSKPKDQQNRISRYFQILHHECDREIRLIEDLLSLQQTETDSWPVSEVHLAEWLPPLVQSFQTLAQEKQQTLEAHIPSCLPTLHTNAQRLQRVITELIENACKHSPEHECIHVTASATSQVVRFQISNTGVSIPDGELERVFEIFYRVPSTDPWKQGGTGLGLTLAKRLVTHLGGTVWAESHDQETQFTVELPLQE